MASAQETPKPVSPVPTATVTPKPTPRPRPKMSWERAFERLHSRLKADGLKGRALAPFNVAKLKYVERAVEAKMLNVIRPMAPFGDYADEKSVHKGREFLKDHEAAFNLAQKESDVAPSIMAAILWIETRYGVYKPRFFELSVLASLAALSDGEFGKEVAAKIAEKAKSEEPKAAALDWTNRAFEIGSAWYEELKSFLLVCEIRGWNARKIKGSWAGAVGYGQFMPKTALRNMTQGPTVWLADLWSWDDTIRLVARHLKENGWSPAAAVGAKKEAILKYNRHTGYADAVFALATQLEQPPRTPTPTIGDTYQLKITNEINLINHQNSVGL
ncbi:MAG: lytic murein transglycosylase [Pseudomonadota bacterium]